MAIPLVDGARSQAGRPAVVTPGSRYSYADLLHSSAAVATALLDDRCDLEEARVAFLVPADFTYPAVQWGIWRAGGIAVPLCLAHPEPELDYVVADSGAEILVAHRDLIGRLESIARRHGRRLVAAEELTVADPGELPDVAVDRRAQIIYTSGTTSRPKGAVTTHANTAAQISSLIRAWDWTADDRVLLVLPLHHVHGVVNVLGCALGSGATCEMLPSFDARTVWERLAGDELTLFMAVPTIYQRLIAAWHGCSAEDRRRFSRGASRLRLMVSGSAALPVRVLEEWREITGQVLLERYGMTEIGMALSNPLCGERRPGSVGLPLPGVEVRAVDEHGRQVAEGESGEIEVRGETVFREYWRRPEETEAAFHDGWFRTGDMAVLERGYYRIRGRQSVDIIKTGGYKVSALEIEEVLRSHPAIAECAVVGVPDEEWGERVAVAAVLHAGEQLSLDGLRRWGRERLAPYKVPSRLLTPAQLPRNVLGKVTKPELRLQFTDPEADSRARR